jgi:hypothetical protein
VGGVLVTLLGIDPGKTIGWSVWEYEWGEPRELGRGTFDYHEIRDRLRLEHHEYGTDLWFKPVPTLFEAYIGRPGQKNGGQRFWGPESLAKIELLGELAGIEVKRQRAVDVLKVSALHAGYTMPKGHLPDQDSAYLHARYRLEELGVLRAKPLDS